MTLRNIVFVAACLALAACRPQGAGSQAGPISAQPIDQAQPIYREIKDWIVGCDNSRNCRAKFVADLDTFRENMLQHHSARMLVEQQAGPEGRLTITLAVLGEEAQEKFRTAPGLFDPKNALRLDGQPLSRLKANWSRAEDGPTFALSGDQARAFLREIRGGSLLTFNEEPESPAVSLHGLMAVLLVMDEAQGRLDNRTALAREGEGPASLVPAPPPMPVVQPAPATEPLPGAAALAAAVRKTHAADFKTHGCDDLGELDSAHRLSATEGLVLAQCLQGAYQGSFLAFTGPIADPAAATLLRLPLPAAANPLLEGVDPAEYEGEYGGATFDPREATFSKIGLARGLGDCGQSAKWAYDGRQFQLIEVKYQERCGDMASDWMLLYRAALAKPN